MATVIRVKDKIYHLWETKTDAGLLFTLYGLKTKKRVLIIEGPRPFEITEHILDLGEKRLPPFEIIFYLSQGPANALLSNDRNTVQRVFGKLGEQVIFVDVLRWEKEANIPDWLLNWSLDVFYSMAKNPRFLVGQIKERKELERKKRELEYLKTNLQIQKNELKEEEAFLKREQTNSENIKRMTWIKDLTLNSGGLTILTNPLACTYLPSLANYYSAKEIEKSDLLYQMVKYQLLGKYFIALPSYYKISNNYMISSLENTRHPLTPSRKLIITNTYFHDMACHIGNGGACLGELSAAVGSNAHKTGLDMLLMSFEVYLRSINVLDSAGARLYALPMGNEKGEVEIWPFAETLLKMGKVKTEKGKRSLEFYDRALEAPEMANYLIHAMSDVPSPRPIENLERNERIIMDLIQTREPEVYEKIIERKLADARKNNEMEVEA